MSSEEKIKKIALELLKKKYIKRDEIVKSLGDAKHLPKFENVLFDRLNAVGLELVRVQYDNEPYYVVIVSESAPEIDAATMGVFSILAGYLELNDGRRNAKIIEEMFFSQKSKLTKLKDKDFIKIDINDDYRITPLGKAILFEVWEDLPKIMHEKLDTLKL